MVAVGMIFFHKIKAYLSMSLGPFLACLGVYVFECLRGSSKLFGNSAFSIIYPVHT